MKKGLESDQSKLERQSMQKELIYFDQKAIFGIDMSKKDSSSLLI